MLVSCQLVTIILDLVPLGGKNLFRPHPQNKILVPFRGFFSKFPMITLVTFIWQYLPGGGGRVSNIEKQKNETVTGMSIEEAFEKVHFLLQIRVTTRQASSGDAEKPHWRRNVDGSL